MAEIQVGDTVRLLDRRGDVRGTVRRILPAARKFAIEVQLKPGRKDSRFFFAENELEVLQHERI